MSRGFVAALVLAACGPQVPVDTSDADDATGGADDLPPLSSSSTSTAADDADESEGADEAIIDDFGGGGGGDGCGDADDPCPLDILVVVDNSGTMADPQLALTRSLVPLVGRLENADGSLTAVADVQMMFTTTDMGNPVCTQFQPAGYEPARGAPTTTGCNLRLDDFKSLGGNSETREDVCTTMCPADVQPGDPFIAFVGNDPLNVPDAAPRDVDGDGTLDSAAAQAVACLAPQGINGCGYEAPLEAMVQALNPQAEWNIGERPFLRPASTLLIVLVSDETDCSTDDSGWMNEPIYWESKPGGGPQPSSAMCWNAGIVCDGPDVDGVQHDCRSNDGPLMPVSRYTDLLIGQLRELEGREVLMVAITGVPIVTQMNQSPPYQPVAGGIDSLVIHEWRDGIYPRGDLLAEDVRDGVEVEDKNWEFGIGPGCTELDGPNGAPVQGIPSPRVHEVCEALHTETAVGCCIESVCDPEPSLYCIDGWLSPIQGGPPKG